MLYGSFPVKNETNENIFLFFLAFTNKPSTFALCSCREITRK